jgi:hypothetical protein
VRRFLPAYAVWAGRAPARLPASDIRIISLDDDRRVATT